MDFERYFTNHEELQAFFSTKPEKTAQLIPQLASELSEGDYFIKPWLVHGKHIQVVDRDFLDGPHPAASGYPELAGKKGYIEVPETDGLVTDIPGVAIVTTHGDCLPVYAYDPVLHVAGIAHAGWKGTMLGIAGELVKTMMAHYGCTAENIECIIGPGIDKCHFEVKEDVKALFAASVPNAYSFIQRKDNEHYLIDLKGINAQFLRMQGVSKIETSPECTFCLENKYWSYRRCGDKDRMLASIKILSKNDK